MAAHWVQMGQKWNKEYIKAIDLDGWGQVFVGVDCFVVVVVLVLERRFCVFLALHILVFEPYAKRTLIKEDLCRLLQSLLEEFLCEIFDLNKHTPTQHTIEESREGYD